MQPQYLLSVSRAEELLIGGLLDCLFERAANYSLAS